MSEWRNVPAGVPQGTKLGPWLFILMLDDINISNTELWKYVDDTTIAECVHKKEDSRIQSDVKELIAKSNQNKFQQTSQSVRNYGFRSLNQPRTLLPLLSTKKQ